jgi:hypothetical protein
MGKKQFTLAGEFGVNLIHDVMVSIKGTNTLANAARKQGEFEMRVADANIRSEYKKRITEVSHVKSHAEIVAKDLRVERSNIEEVKSRVVTLLRDLQGPLSISIQWMELQDKMRSPSLKAKVQHESVEQAFTSASTNIKHAIKDLSLRLSELLKFATDIEKVTQKLEKDIVVKMGTLMIDKACMEDLVEAEEPKSFPQHPGALWRKSEMHTENEWVRNASAVINEALSVYANSKNARKRAAELVQTVRDSELLSRPPGVVDAIGQQAKYHEGIDRSLELHSKALEQKSQTLHSQKEALEVSLDQVVAQLASTKQRLKVCFIRPEADGAPVNVEEALELEIAKLKKTKKDLEAKISSIVKTIASVEETVAEVRQQQQVNHQALSTAKQCLSIKLPEIRSPRNTPRETRKGTL